MALDNNQSETAETWRREGQKLYTDKAVIHVEPLRWAPEAEMTAIVDETMALLLAAQEAAKLREALEKIIDSQTMPAYEYSVKWGELPTRPEQRARAALGVSDD